MTGGDAQFVTVSRAGRIVRLVGGSTRTVTKLSGDIVDIAVHPLKPLIGWRTRLLHDGLRPPQDWLCLRVRSDAT